MVSMVGAGQETDGTKLREPALWQRAAPRGCCTGKGGPDTALCLSEGRLWARERVELPYGALDEGGIQLDQHHGQGET